MSPSKSAKLAPGTSNAVEAMHFSVTLTSSIFLSYIRVFELKDKVGL